MLKNFKEVYKTDVVKKLQDEFKYSNVHQMPAIKKVVINMCVGDVVNNSKAIDAAVEDLKLISGQKPIITKAKKSIAAYKLREGMKLGCKVTLRKDMMYQFLERLVIMALPRVKDFRGFSTKSFDGRGNLNFGIKEHVVFSEIDYDKVDKSRGMDITIVTSAATDKEAKSLLSGMFIPFYN